MQPFFSIIIPTLNEEQFLPRLLSDLEEQKEKNFEVFVVDGNSSDKTQQIILGYKKYIPVTLLKMDPPNLPLQKNLGASYAAGPYLLFLDADMSISSLFSARAQKLIKEKKGIVFQPYVLPLEKDSYPEVTAIFPLLNKLVEFSQNFDKPFSAGPAMFWQREAFLTIGGFDNIFGEDHHIIRKAHSWGIRPKFLPRIKVLFSLRRMKREGRLLVLYKVLTSH
ncbi:glycosyltransferase, partial [Candidatus Roizmanbacteria bacterium]|nr:glycosyltransferase [Candidatus Roizmanbacteria bacterium]